MFIIEVIPLTLLPPNVPQILSYFFDPVRGPARLKGVVGRRSAFGGRLTSNGTGSELPKGAIVEVLINNRRVKAVVISSSSIEKQKLSLKKVDFQIKKINKIIYDDPQISDYQLKLAVWISKHYHAPLGYTLKTLLPSFVFKKKFPITTNNQLIHSCDITTRGVVISQPELWVYKSRKLVNYLESVVRETIANSKQVLIVVPEKTIIDYFKNYFSNKYPTSGVCSGLSNSELYRSWCDAQSGKPAVFIGTRQALNMHYRNLGLVIVEDPLHEFYKSDMIPRYSAVTLAHKVAELNNSRLILTTVIPGTEYYYKTKTGIYNLKQTDKRTEFEPEIIDMSHEIRNASWGIISRKLTEEILSGLKNNEKILIYSPRRGYSGVLMCSNCNSAVKCPRCEVAMKTHRSVEMILVCHHCGVSRLLPKNCPVCGNYNLKTAGYAGTQKIYDAVKSTINKEELNTTVLALDSDVVKNEAEEEEIISEIEKSKSAVLIATQTILSHRFRLKFDLMAIINEDALTNMPDFKSEENLFYQIEKLLCFEPKKLFIQTYNPDNKILNQAVGGEYDDFYENELKLREALNYPPFYKFIKLTFRHKDKNKASYAAKITTEKLKMAVARLKAEESVKVMEATPAYIEKERRLYIFNVFLKVKEDYQDIGQILKYIEPGWIVDVEPRSLL